MNKYTGPLLHTWTEEDDVRFPNATEYFKAIYHPDMMEAVYNHALENEPDEELLSKIK